MAEYVHQQMEKMAGEFEQMHRFGLCTPKEIRAMVKKRESFEYKLVQRQKQKKHYLSYITYEIGVLNIVNSRRKKIKYFGRPEEIEYAIVQRIHRIFKASLVRWSDDIQLWMSHARFCLKWNKKVQLSKLCTKMLSLHGHQPLYWILAAKWEFECGQSEDNCRNIFLKALDHHENNKDILLEYFRAELLFTDVKRRRLLVLRNNASIDDEEEDDSDDDDEEKQKDKLVMSGGLASIVYQNAREAYPDDSELAIKFVQVAKLFTSVAFGEKIYRDIVSDLRHNFAGVPKVCSTLAMFKLDQDQTNYQARNKMLEQEYKDEQAYKEMEKSVANFNNDQMKNEYFNFALQIATTSHPIPDVAENRFDKLLQIIKQESICNALDEQNLIKLAKLLNSKAMYDVTVATVGNRNNTSPELAFLCLKAQIGLGEDNATESFMMTLPQVKSMNENTRSEFWKLWMTQAITENNFELGEQIACHHCEGDDDAAMDTKISLLKWMIACDGDSGRAYQIYKNKMSKTKHNLKFYEKILKVFADSDLNQQELRQMHELGLRIHGSTSIFLWVEYLKFARTTMPGESAHIYQRALKSLKEDFVQDFVEEFNKVSINS